MSQASIPTRQLIIIDSKVNNWQTLANDVSTDNLVLILDSSSDGLTQISDYLTTLSASAGAENFAPLQSIHIISHGSEGSLLLGSSILTSSNLSLYSRQLANLGNALSENGDILLYGCNVAADQMGLQFIKQFADLTNADVAASNDITGPAMLGGDWQLEAATGRIESSLALSLAGLNTYTDILADSASLPIISLAPLSPRVTEGNTGTSVITMTVILSSASISTVTVNYATSSDFGFNATASSDYVAANGVLTFAEGETTKTFDIVVNGDTIYEDDEWLSINLSLPSGAILDNNGGSSAILQITNDDTVFNHAPTLTAFTSAVAGGNQGNRITISLADLQAQGNEADVDGTVDSFVIKAISSGTLTIGTSAGAATAWNAITNNTIDATHQAFWTPAANANGTLNAFTATAKDNGGAESATAIQATLAVAVADTAAPTVTITDNLPGTANRATNSIVYTLAFSESVTGLEANDFTITNGVVSSVLGDGSTWTVNVIPALGVTGTIGLTLKGGAVSDAVGNVNVSRANTSQLIDTAAPVAPKLITGAGFNFLTDPQLTMQTSLGTVVLELNPEKAPVTVANMLAYANTGFYDNTLFHRVIPGFMVQGGGFTSGPSYKEPAYSPIVLESNNGLANLRGTIAMARTSVADSATSQFFVNQVDNGFLNYRSSAAPGYAVFGKVVSGLPVIDSIAQVPRRSIGQFDDVPITDITITSIRQTQAGSSITNLGTLAISGLESGTQWSYSLDSGATWTAGAGNSLAVPVGNYAASAIQVRQTDTAGNASTGKLTSALVVDTTAPTVTSFSPADGATAVAVGSNIVFTFSEAAQAGTGNFIIFNANGTVEKTIAVTDTSQVSISGNTVTINPNTDLAAGGNSYYVTINAGVIKDLAGNSFAGITGTTAYNFTTINNAPILTVFTSAVAGGNEDSEITVTFAHLQAQGNEADVDGTVTGIVIKDISSGTLKIGSSAETANVWDAITNNTIDATHNAYWTPDGNANGSLNAFTAVVKDNAGLESATAIQATVVATAVNDVPTLTAFVGAVAGGNEDSQITVTFADLQNQGNEVDVDGPVTGFVIKDISSGTLIIGSSDSTAAAWNEITNNTIDATHNAYWTPDANANGTLNAFTAVVKGSNGLESVAAIQAAVAVTAVNDGPGLTTPTAINYTDTAFDNTFATVTGSLIASDIDGTWLIYGIAGGADNGDGTIRTALDEGIVAGLNTLLTHPTIGVDDNGNGTLSQSSPYGVLTVTISTGAYSFVPNDAAIEALTTTANTLFTVTASDGSLTASHTLAINIAQQGRTASIGTESTGNDRLTGTSGDDRLDGLGGADTMTGRSGDDIYTVDNPRDVVIENTRGGIDTIISSISYTLNFNVENLILSGTAALNGTGNTLNNVLTGNAGDNTLNGGAGADTLVGGSGNDIYMVDNEGDVLTETSTLVDEIDTVKSSKTYTLGANLENLTLTGSTAIDGTGNALNNILTGNKGANVLDGGDGDDVLEGGIGNDTLTGGAGHDIFQLKNSSQDTITDFSVLDDTIQLANRVFTQLTATGDLNAENFNIGAAAADANDYVIYDSNTGALYYDTNGSDAGGATQIAMLGMGLALTHADFFVI